MVLQTYKISADSNDRLEIVECARDWAVINGMTIRCRDSPDSSEVVEVVPFTLFPSPFPRLMFQQAMDVQQVMNRLYHRIAFDIEFLSNALKRSAEVDPFVAKLLKIYHKVSQEANLDERVVLNVQRSDYMMHESHHNGNKVVQLKQVEVNNIAAGLPALGTLCGRLHRMILSKHLEFSISQSNLPLTDDLNVASRGLFEAWKLYGKPSAAIVFIVEDHPRNYADQRMIEYQVEHASQNSVSVYRINLNDCHGMMKLSENRLFLRKGNIEIAVVYFRTGYAPDQFRDQNAWDALLMIEKSLAIKCPWIGFHLAGTKRVQQLLSNPVILRRFVNDETEIEKVMSVTMEMLDFNIYKAENESKWKYVYQEHDEFVLKPLREGGGNNLFGEKILSLGSDYVPEEMDKYIAMRRIRTPSHQNILVKRAAAPTLSNCVSEIGVFGSVLGTKNHILMQNHGSFIMRTKLASDNEGGLMSGLCCLDSPYLY